MSAWRLEPETGAPNTEGDTDSPCGVRLGLAHVRTRVCASTDTWKHTHTCSPAGSTDSSTAQSAAGSRSVLKYRFPLKEPGLLGQTADPRAAAGEGQDDPGKPV